MRFILLFVLLMVPRIVLCDDNASAHDSFQRDAVLARAEANAAAISAALDRVPADQVAGMQFLLDNMPQHDLRSLSAEYLLENVDYAYRAWRETPWNVPEEIFLNNILPYASINERRDAWRKDFYDRFREHVKEATSTGQAATILNRTIFSELNVKYSTKRRRADQSPMESIESGLASCTGLSILLIDACRAVGIPARFVGTPLWSDGSGNHSWVEVWDDGWHFTGAAEPTGEELDQAWFVARASQAQRDDPRHAIFAVSFRATPILFPLVWDRSIDFVHAVNVTDRYANKVAELPANHAYAMFRASANGQRCCTPFLIKDAEGKVVFEGETRDERFDANDHTTVVLPLDTPFDVVFGDGTQKTITTKADAATRNLFSFEVQTK